MAEEVAIQSALRQFRDEIVRVGWPIVGATAPTTTSVSNGSDSPAMATPLLVLVDSGHWEATVVGFCMESGGGFLPSKGFGIQQLGRRRILTEPGYESVAQSAGYNLVEVNADYWKSFVHSRLQTPSGRPGGLTLFHARSVEHLSFAKQFLARSG
jgi:hypothetical protein